jgi:hypothetical protein
MVSAKFRSDEPRFRFCLFFAWVGYGERVAKVAKVANQSCRTAQDDRRRVQRCMQNVIANRMLSMDAFHTDFARSHHKKEDVGDQSW